MIIGKRIPEYQDYLITRYGRIWSTKSNKWLKIHKHKNNRDYVTLSTQGTPKKFLISRLVCRVYGDLPSLFSELEVDHKDRDRTNNYYKNLQALTMEAHEAKSFEERGHARREEDNKCACGTVIQHVSTECWECHVSNRKLINPSISEEDIVYWVLNYSWIRAAKELGLSDTGLRKRYTKLTGKDPKYIKQDHCG